MSFLIIWRTNKKKERKKDRKNRKNCFLSKSNVKINSIYCFSCLFFQSFARAFSPFGGKDTKKEPNDRNSRKGPFKFTKERH